VQSAAIAALCGSDPVATARLAGESLIHLHEAAAVQEIFSAFLQRQGGAAALANALTGKMPPKSAAEIGLRLMNASGRRNEQLAHLLTEAAGLIGEGKKWTTAEIALFATEVRSGGDAKNGAAIFQRPELGCLACHLVNGEGGKIGPDLSALGTAQPLDFIIGAILEPQKEIKEGYTSISVTTKKGEEYQGYPVRETVDELVLRDILQNKEVRLRLDLIKERMPNGSVMPGGLIDSLTRTEFRDLVRFLSELGRPR